MVSRETSLADGLAALGLRQDVVPLLARLAEILSSEAVAQGLLGRSDVPRLVHRHILESCALAIRAPKVDALVDVGSGAGLPGLPLSLVLRARLVCVESRRKAASFLRRTSADLGVDAEIVARPAEEVAHTDLREQFDFVVARALAPPPVALELTIPFARPGGRVAVVVGPSYRATEDAAARAAVVLGGRAPRYDSLEVPGAEAATWVMMVDKVARTPERFPRRPGIPRRRPLGGPVTEVK